MSACKCAEANLYKHKDLTTAYEADGTPFNDGYIANPSSIPYADGLSIYKLMWLRRPSTPGQHVDAPKCHPNTRQAVLDEIMNWIILAAARVQWILWLNGAAGAGKSAIGRSYRGSLPPEEYPNRTLLLFPERLPCETVSNLWSLHLYISSCRAYRT